MLQGREPVNFPQGNYNKEEICQDTSFEDFLKRHRRAAEQVISCACQPALVHVPSCEMHHKLGDSDLLEAQLPLLVSALSTCLLSCKQAQQSERCLPTCFHSKLVA